MNVILMRIIMGRNKRDLGKAKATDLDLIPSCEYGPKLMRDTSSSLERYVHIRLEERS